MLARTRLVDIEVRAGGTEPVETELLVSVLLPTHGRHDLDGERGDAVGEDAEPVLLGLAVEDLEARERDNTGLDAVVVGEVLGGLDADRDLGTGGDEGYLGTLDLLEDVTTTGSVVDSGSLKLGKVLTRESDDAGASLVGESNLVGGARLVAVSRAPDHAVGKSAEVGQGLDRLVSGTVLAETDGVVGGDPDDADVGESGQTDGTGGVGDEVEESTTIGDDGTVSGKTVHDSTHTVLTDTVADVAARVVSKAGGGGLEVNSTLPPREVGASKIGGSTDELGEDGLDLAEDNLGELSGGDSRVGGGVDGESLLPALG